MRANSTQVSQVSNVQYRHQKLTQREFKSISQILNILQTSL